jgi:hypothetical protein
MAALRNQHYSRSMISPVACYPCHPYNMRNVLFRVALSLMRAFGMCSML